MKHNSRPSSDIRFLYGIDTPKTQLTVQKVLEQAIANVLLDRDNS